MKKFAVAAVIQDDDKILLHRRSLESRGQAGKWENAGGEIEKNESSEEAIIREVYEELGVEFVPEKVLLKGDYDNGGELWNVTIFKGHIIGIPKIISDKVTAEIKWVSLSELTNYDLASYTREDFIKLGWISGSNS